MVSAIALLEWKRKTIIVCRCSSSIGSKLIRNDLMKLFLRIFSHFSSTQLKNQIANYTDQDERFAIEKNHIKLIVFHLDMTIVATDSTPFVNQITNLWIKNLNYSVMLNVKVFTVFSGCSSLSKQLTYPSHNVFSNVSVEWGALNRDLSKFIL